MGAVMQMRPWRDQPPLIGPEGEAAHHVEFDPARGHRCLSDCPGYHPADEDEQLAAPPVMGGPAL